MSAEQSNTWDETGHMEVLTFDMEGETFAIEAGLVREILDRIPETAVPGASTMIGGLINFRGRVIPLADLHQAFGFASRDATFDSRVIVIEIVIDGEDTLVGLKADKVNEVIVLEKVSAEAAPRVGMKWRQDFIRCLAKRNGDFIVVPDLEHLFAAARNAGARADTAFTKH